MKPTIRYVQDIIFKYDSEKKKTIKIETLARQKRNLIQLKIKEKRKNTLLYQWLGCLALFCHYFVHTLQAIPI